MKSMIKWTGVLGSIKLHETLNRLPEVLRSAMLLRFFSNWQSYEQMAAILDVPVGTIRSRLNQAKQKMAEHWMKGTQETEKHFLEDEQWNDYYVSHFSLLHSSSEVRGRFVQHLDKNLSLVFTSGSTGHGRRLLEKVIEDDLTYGSGFERIEVMTSGSISIVEVNNVNSSEFPNRCPESGVFVLFRNGDKIKQLNLHNSR